MGKIILLVLAIMVVIAIVIKFKAFFIALAVLGAVGYAITALYKKNKSATITSSEVPKGAENPSAFQKTHVSEKVKEHESIVNEYEVTGIVFYLKNLLPLMEPNYLWDYKKQDLIDTCNYDEPIYKTTLTECRLSLSPEPDNPHDPNAIMVLLNDRLVGYIAAKDCKHVLNVINNDLMISMTCKVRGGKYKMLCEDYDSYRDKSTYSMEHGEDEYGITIYIREKTNA